MKKESRNVIYDRDLRIEAYRFEGIMQKFPNHFHEHYVIGFIECGTRHLAVNNREYTTEPSDLLLFNPRTPHTCWQIDGGALDYRCLNIDADVMSGIAAEITGRCFTPSFREQVVRHCELVPALRELHSIILDGGDLLRKQELFYIFMSNLINRFAKEPLAQRDQGESRVISKVCAYIENNYEKNLALDELAALSGLNKYNLLRLFARERGITPYKYLETVRINRAKALLEQGEQLSEIALESGFSDQSHFTNFFKKFIGFTPKQYANIFTKKRSGGDAA